MLEKNTVHVLCFFTDAEFCIIPLRVAKQKEVVTWINCANMIGYLALFQINPYHKGHVTSFTYCDFRLYRMYNCSLSWVLLMIIEKLYSSHSIISFLEKRSLTVALICVITMEIRDGGNTAADEKMSHMIYQNISDPKKSQSYWRKNSN